MKRASARAIGGPAAVRASAGRMGTAMRRRMRELRIGLESKKEHQRP